MKKILSILFLFSSLLSFGQAATVQELRSHTFKMKPFSIKGSTKPTNLKEISLDTLLKATDNQITVAGLRALSGFTPFESYLITDEGKEGIFKLDKTDDTSIDNLGTILVDASGRRWKRIYEGGANITWFGCKLDGIIDDSIPFQNAINSCNDIYVPSAKTTLVGNIIVNSNKRINGYGTLKIKKNSIGLKFLGNNASIDNVKIEANSCLYAIYFEGQNLSAKNIVFSGSCGHFLFTINSKNISVKENKIQNNINYTNVTCFVFDNSENFVFSENYIKNTTGFGIQTRFSKNGEISNNTFIQDLYSSTIITSNNTSSVNIALPYKCERVGILVNDIPNSATVTTADYVNFNVNFASTINAGTEIKIIGSRCLENVNINSNSSHIYILHNDIDGTGDSGIILGADYHNKTLNPNLVDSSDYGNDIIVKNNYIKNCFFAGIAETHAFSDVLIDGNNIEDCSLANTSIPFASGILLTGTNQVVCNNTIKSSKNQRTKYGIFVSGYDVENGDFNKAIKLYNNHYVGSYFEKYIYIPNQLPGFRKQNIDVINSSISDYIETINLDSPWTNKPQDTNFLSYTYFGSIGVIRDISEKMGGIASLKTVASERIDVKLEVSEFYKDKLLIIEFYAKNNSGSSFVTCFTSLGGNYAPITINITKNSWQKYKMTIPMQDLTENLTIIRIGSNSGSANFQHFKFKVVELY